MALKAKEPLEVRPGVARGGYTEKDVERNIFANPFKRFADMRFLQRCRDLEWVQINRDIFKKLTDEDVDEILKVCDAKLGEYYSRSAFGGGAEII